MFRRTDCLGLVAALILTLPSLALSISLRNVARGDRDEPFPDMRDVLQREEVERNSKRDSASSLSSYNDFARDSKYFSEPLPSSDFEIADYRMAVRECLKNKKVDVMGNSVSRHWFFIFRDLLGEDGLTSSNSRRDEKDSLRGKAKDYADAWAAKQAALAEAALHPGDGNMLPGCEIRKSGCLKDVGISNKTELRYFFWTKVYDGMIRKDRSAIAKTCPDLLTINTGADDILHPVYRLTWNETLHREVPQLRQALEEAHAACPNMRSYWRTSTHLCNQDKHGMGEGAFVHWSHGPTLEQLQPDIEYSNKVIAEALSGIPNLKIFDSWGKSANRCDDYEDMIHHSKLAHEHVRDFFHDYCGLK